ncbi:LysM peptidoglycan-binding domain-containing protein [Chondromyces apiculatus]|uniref:LysM domain-containing protein n=1 Tax=Chondromyces apiculatus DSM 436 TaxID=1192034 RepID=A0A017T4A2_9BACT|nr:LysM peptidoglycan-binding domain-containing protein [Chondromyces apiculatus]EYF04073.1 Hypothetical protein CAP_4947 [Chondromyces apiculatus DSM 436]
MLINGRAALRVCDPGEHGSGGTWEATKGSTGVFFNGMAVHRLGDQTKHGDAEGQLTQASPNVFVGDMGPGSSKTMPHNRSVTLEVTDGMQRQVQQAVARVTCPHKTYEDKPFTHKIELTGLCDGASVTLVKSLQQGEWDSAAMRGGTVSPSYAHLNGPGAAATPTAAPAAAAPAAAAPAAAAPAAAAPAAAAPAAAAAPQALSAAPAAVTRAASPASSYAVKRGDTLSAIASRNNTTVAALRQANPQLRNPNLLSIGQNLNIPGAPGAAPASAASPPAASPPVASPPAATPPAASASPPIPQPRPAQVSPPAAPASPPAAPASPPIPQPRPAQVSPPAAPASPPAAPASPPAAQASPPAQTVQPGQQAVHAPAPSGTPGSESQVTVARPSSATTRVQLTTVHNWVEMVFKAFNLTLPTEAKKVALLGVREAGLGGTEANAAAGKNTESRSTRAAAMSTATTYNDLLYVVWTDDDAAKTQKVEVFECTIDPGKTASALGTPYLLEGKEYLCRPGHHIPKKYPGTDIALHIYTGTYGKIKLAREATKAYRIFKDVASAKTTSNWKFVNTEDNSTIHMHFGGAGATVGGWSVGCTVLHHQRTSDRYKRFQAIYRAAANKTKIPYLVVSSQYTRLYAEWVKEVDKTPGQPAEPKSVIIQSALKSPRGKEGQYLPSIMTEDFANAVLDLAASNSTNAAKAANLRTSLDAALFTVAT